MSCKKGHIYATMQFSFYGNVQEVEEIIRL